MLVLKCCKLSRKVSYDKFKVVTEKFNRVPKSMLEFHKIMPLNNLLIETLVSHIPYLHLDACYQIRNNWYKFQLCFCHGNTLRFAQLDVTSPLEGEQRIKNIRYIDIEVM